MTVNNNKDISISKSSILSHRDRASEIYANFAIKRKNILGANRTEDLLLVRIEIVSSYYCIVSFSLFLLRSSVSNGRPYCYSSVSFSLLRSSVSNGRPYCYSIVSFSLLLLRSSVFSGRPSYYSTVSSCLLFLLLLLFFLVWFAIFSAVSWSIFVKFSGNMSLDEKSLLPKSCAKVHFRFRVMSLLVTFLRPILSRSKLCNYHR